MSRSARHWLQIAALTSLIVATLIFGAASFVTATVNEFYSSGIYAKSSAEASARGLLRARPVVLGQPQIFHGDTLTIADSWVEQVTHLEYRWHLVRRESRDPSYRLVLRAAQEWRPTDFGCDRSLAYGDSTFLGTSGGSYFIDVRRDLAFPDTIRLHVVRNPSCDGKEEQPTVPANDTLKPTGSS